MSQNDQMFVAGDASLGLSKETGQPLRYAVTSSEPFEVTHVMLQLMASGSRILDIGCGTGAMTIALKQNLQAEVLGIEPHPDRADAARSLGLDIITGRFHPELEKTHGRFDYVVLADVLEHLDDPGALLRSLDGVLAPGGHVIASVPNVAHWTVRLALLRGRFDYQPTGIMDGTHLRWFTKSSIRNLFETSGYRVNVLTHTAGAWMPDYGKFPFSLIDKRRRPSLINKLAQNFHGLFACQHVVSASRQT